jgi:hypothetical protein
VSHAPDAARSPLVLGQDLDGESLNGLKVERRHGQATALAANQDRGLFRAQNNACRLLRVDERQK